ncbi:MAG: hypothetical protein AB4426_13830 [Xenococcaceae cyanobacterium]
MEPITWGWILLAALSGIVGNRADMVLDQACGKGFKALINRFKQGDEPSDRNLQKAVRRSFLLAQQSIASECRAELIGNSPRYYGLSGVEVYPEAHKAEILWLDGKLQQLKDELKQLEKAALVETPIASLEEIESLLTPEGALAGDRIQGVRETLIAAVGQEGAVPSYQAKLEQEGVGLFERMCAYFAFEIKNNSVINNILQGQLLTQINANLRGLQVQQLTVQDLEDSLRDLARDVPQVLNQLDNLEEAIEEVSEGVGDVRSLVATSSTEILEVVITTAADIEEIKALLRKLQGGKDVHPTRPALPAKQPNDINPFDYGTPVPPERFYGRRKAILEVKSRIGAISAQCINIVGMRRVGKTSLLRYIKERPEVFFHPSQKPLIVTLDLQSNKFHTPEGMIEGLRYNIKKLTGEEIWSQNANNDSYEVEDGLERLRDNGHRLIVMIDEFEEIGAHLNQFQDWGKDWRAKASDSLLTMVIFSLRPIEDIYKHLGLTSPFENIFSRTILGALEEEAWHSLVQDGFSVKNVNETSLQWIDELAGSLPFYVKMAASMLWQYGDFEQAKTEFIREATPHFRKLWDDLTTPECQALLHAAGISDVAIPNAAIIDTLQRHGLLRSDGRLFSSAFADFIRVQR